jgi:hypothetical protein
MAIFKENIDVVNPEGSDGNQSRKSELNFYGFLSTDESLNEAFSGIGDTVYTDADNGGGPILNDATFGGNYTQIGTGTYTVEIDSQGTPDTFKWTKDNFSTTEASNVPITGSVQTLDHGVTIEFNATTGHELGDQWQMTILTTTSESHQLGSVSAYHEGTGNDHKANLTLSVNTDGYPSPTVQSTGTGLDDATFGGRHTSNKSLTPITYYVKIVGTGNPNTFAWSKDNFVTTEATGVPITGSAIALENGITITFGSTTGHTLNDVWKTTVYEPSMVVYSNNTVKFAADVILTGGTTLAFKVYDVNGNLLNSP